MICPGPREMRCVCLWHPPSALHRRCRIALSLVVVPPVPPAPSLVAALARGATSCSIHTAACPATPPAFTAADPAPAVAAEVPALLQAPTPCALDAGGVAFGWGCLLGSARSGWGRRSARGGWARRSARGGRTRRSARGGRLTALAQIVAVSQVAPNRALGEFHGLLGGRARFVADGDFFGWIGCR